MSETRTVVQPRCPDCGKALDRVRNTGGMLNDDQFDSVRAGEKFIVCLPVYTDGRGRRESSEHKTLAEAREAQCYLMPQYRAVSWIEQADTRYLRLTNPTFNDELTP